MKNAKLVLKAIWEFSLGLTILLILPTIVYLIAIKSIAYALGIMTLLILLGIITILNKLELLTKQQSKKEFLQMFNTQNN